MNSGSATRNSRDILSNRWAVLGLFCLPTAAMVVAGFPSVSIGWRTAVWTAALTIMGIACLANARRCGRLHCYITGPFFLLMAVVTLLYGLAFLPLGRGGWSLIGLTVLVGAIVFTCLPEMLFGRYRKT